MCSYARMLVCFIQFTCNAFEYRVYGVPEFCTFEYFVTVSGQGNLFSTHLNLGERKQDRSPTIFFPFSFLPPSIILLFFRADASIWSLHRNNNNNNNTLTAYAHLYGTKIKISNCKLVVMVRWRQ